MTIELFTFHYVAVPTEKMFRDEAIARGDVQPEPLLNVRLVATVDWSKVSAERSLPMPGSDPGIAEPGQEI